MLNGKVWAHRGALAYLAHGLADRPVACRSGWLLACIREKEKHDY